MRQIEHEPRSAYGQWVLEVLRKHGDTLRGQRRRTGIPHSTVTGWLQDIPPQMQGVIAFARGFGEDEDRALAMAQYEPPDVLEAAEQFVRAVERKTGKELTYELHDDDGVPGAAYGGGGGDARTRAVIARVRQAARAVELQRWGIGDPPEEQDP